MDDNYIIKPVARIYTDFSERVGIPRQSGLIPELTARIIFEKDFRDKNAVRGIEEFSHLWLIWGFSETCIDMSSEHIQWSPTVAPPRLGGNIRKGVFSTRSPYRPNSLGLSSVRLISVDYDHPESPVLNVGGADILDGSPVFDIKPYIPYSDIHPDARGGFSVSDESFLKVNFPDELIKSIPADKRNALLKVLSQDPRGSYEKQPGYVYGLRFAGYDIRFTVNCGVLDVFEVINSDTAGISGKIK